MTVVEPPPLGNRFTREKWAVVRCECGEEQVVHEYQYNGGVAVECECGWIDFVDLRQHPSET